MHTVSLEPFNERLCVLSAGKLSSAVVTLDSISIFKTHEWFKLKPTVYFQCKGEDKTVLPDVKEAHVIYTFKGQESWQVCMFPSFRIFRPLIKGIL